MKAEQDMRAKLIEEEQRRISDSVNALMRWREEATGGLSGGFSAAIRPVSPVEVTAKNDARPKNTATTDKNFMSVDTYEYISDSESSSSHDDGGDENSLPSTAENNDFVVRAQSVKSVVVVENKNGTDDDDGGYNRGEEKDEAHKGDGALPPSEPSFLANSLCDLPVTDRGDRGESPLVTVVPNEVPDGEEDDSGDEFSDCSCRTVGSTVTEESFKSSRYETGSVTPEAQTTEKSAKETSWCCIL